MFLFSKLIGHAITRPMLYLCSAPRRLRLPCRPTTLLTGECGIMHGREISSLWSRTCFFLASMFALPYVQSVEATPLVQKFQISPFDVTSKIKPSPTIPMREHSKGSSQRQPVFRRQLSVGSTLSVTPINKVVKRSPVIPLLTPPLLLTPPNTHRGGWIPVSGCGNVCGLESYHSEC